MEVKEFAEQVLFGTTLEDKLIDGGRYQRGHPGSPIAAPGEPGRPQSLALGGWNDRDRVRFREVRGFHSEKERGLVLHFFANHELLAIELMALALLKFPDAPEKFRRGLYGILREEQEHLRLYIERMRGIGVEFGEIPVSDFFWRCISPVETPIEFVTRLSLTLEQANLDYAPHYASVYGELGDEETARLMQRIYRDEIGHVKHGLTWFNSWRDPALGEWEAYTRTLAPPLDPGRAKGIGFNAEGRRKAGLSEAFIGELQVHSQSRGRPPAVFWFNPGCDRCAGLDGVQTPPKWMAQVAEDLETVPALACASADVVLVRRRPRREHLSQLQAAGLEIPEFALFDGAAGLDGHPLAERRLGALRPWGVAPDSEQLLAPLKDSVAGPGQGPAWSSALRRLYSKEWSAALLAEFLEGRREDWLCGADVVGQRCGSMGEVGQALDLLGERGWSRAVIKAPFGAAGRGQVRISKRLGSPEKPRTPWQARSGAGWNGCWRSRVPSWSNRCWKGWPTCRPSTRSAPAGRRSCSASRGSSPTAAGSTSAPSCTARSTGSTSRCAGSCTGTAATAGACGTCTKSWPGRWSPGWRRPVSPGPSGWTRWYTGTAAGCG